MAVAELQNAKYYGICVTVDKQKKYFSLTKTPSGKRVARGEISPKERAVIRARALAYEKKMKAALETSRREDAHRWTTDATKRHKSPYMTRVQGIRLTWKERKGSLYPVVTTSRCGGTFSVLSSSFEDTWIEAISFQFQDRNLRHTAIDALFNMIPDASQFAAALKAIRRTPALKGRRLKVVWPAHLVIRGVTYD